MDTQKALEVLAICLPVFAVMGIGKLLDIRGWLTADHRRTINGLIYYAALPALILNAVARQRVSEFVNPALLVPGFIAVGLLMAIYSLIARCMRFHHGFAAAFVFGTFWANVTYMGFPLANNAFKDEGLALAAVYNAFLMPAFIILGLMLIGIYGKQEDDSWPARIKSIVTNPILLAALLGIILAASAEPFRADSGSLVLPGAITVFLKISGSFLELIGSMGLPLALLTIGGSLHFSKVREHRLALALVIAGKLLLMPLLTLIFTNLLFPEARPETRAVAVLLASTPNAVASYVVAAKAGVDESYVSSMLVISTALSVMSIPACLYFVL